MYTLPTSLEINGIERKIRTDYRDVLEIMAAMNDPNLEDKEKAYVCMYILYEDFESIDSNDFEEAFKKAIWFINNGEEDDGKPKDNKKLVDLEQDARLLFPAVNRVAGFEVRSVEYMHWWTFLGYYMEIGDCTYSHIVCIRKKRSKGKKLEEWEQEFFNNNKDIILIKERLSDEEIEAKEEFKKLFGW